MKISEENTNGQGPLQVILPVFSVAMVAAEMKKVRRLR